MRLAYKAEHVVDLKSDLVVAVNICPADHPDTEIIVDRVMLAQANLQGPGAEHKLKRCPQAISRGPTLELAAAFGPRTYIPDSVARFAGDGPASRPRTDTRSGSTADAGRGQKVTRT